MHIKIFKPQFDYEIQSKINNVIGNLKVLEYDADEQYLSEEIKTLQDTQKTLDDLGDLKQQLSQLQQENEAMKQLIEWIEECDFGFDNFVNDYEEDINMTEEEFDKETENMSYIESMIHYAKLYQKRK